MRLLITGICGFAGSSIAKALLERVEGLEIAGLDNLSRPGSEMNRSRLRGLGIHVFHGDLRLASDMAALPDCDWVIDGAANPSVLAGKDGRTSSRQLLEHNLWGTVETAEYCRRTNAGLILLSTSRVYSIAALAGLPLTERDSAFHVDERKPLPAGVTAAGVREEFSTAAPISLYGSTKLASEILCLEYGEAFGFPVWVNRCGVLAGAGQFGTAEQGIFSYWLHAHAGRRPLRYIGFDGMGKQVRDAMHPDDLAEFLLLEMRAGAEGKNRLWNLGGGADNALSLAQLTRWCDARFGAHAPVPDAAPRPYDIPWLIMDAARAKQAFAWSPRKSIETILNEIAEHVSANPDWLASCGV